jgi:hypothetical protein
MIARKSKGKYTCASTYIQQARHFEDTKRNEDSRANEDYPQKMHDAANPSNLKQKVDTFIRSQYNKGIL